MISPTNISDLTRVAVSAALEASPSHRQALFSLIPKTTITGPFYTLERFFREDSATNAADVRAVAEKAGIDPVELAALYGLDPYFRPLSEHLVRLLSARLAAALSDGQDVTQWAVAITRIIETTGAAVEDKEGTAGQALFISGSDMLAHPVEPKPLLGKVIERDCTGQIFGPSGDGKTFVTLDMALSVGTGSDWNGNKCEQGVVLYFAGEGHVGLRRRVKAWWQHHGQPDLSCCQFTRQAVPFDGAGLSKAIRQATALVEQVGKPVALIVCDTLARHLQGDENSTRDMSDFVRAVDDLRGAFPGSTAIIVHHTGNDSEKVGRSRGSSSLKAACDFEIQCLQGVLTFTKVKDGAAPPPVEFKLVPVEIGIDEDGEPITSCIVQYGERSARNREASLTVTEKMLLGLVNDYPNILSGDLRNKFYDKRREREPDAKTNTLKNAFLRAYHGLLDKGVIHEVKNAVVVLEGKSSHVTKASQNDVVTERESVTSVTHPYKVCDVVTAPITSHSFIDLDGGGVAHVS